MKVTHDWLKDYCGASIPSVEVIDELLTFHAFEIDGIEGDVIDVKVLPDRASDALSHRGIAREIATLTGTPLVYDPLRTSVSLSPVTEKVSISIEDEESCRRFALAVVDGVKVGDSPEWLKSRLEALGQRSINNVVDATNYVMLGLGQPLHAYDADKFEAKDGVWHFDVRMSREGEEVTTLSGDTYTLKNDVQLIVNASTDTPVGIAGIKGGKSAEITADTTRIILEAANFNPQVTRRASQALKLQTDASKRFENNLSPELVPYALHEVVRLIVEIAGGECLGYKDVYPTVITNTPVQVSLSHTQSLLGVELSKEAVEGIFSRLGFSYEVNGEGWIVLAPFERMDITIPEDVIAEIGRVHGYEHIVSILPEVVPLSEYNARHFYSDMIRDILIKEGFSEVITSSFRKKDEVTLLNALASDKGCLRSTLIPNMQEVLDKNVGNVDLLGLSSVQAFEIGTVFGKNAEENDVVEYVSLSLGVRIKNTYTPKDDARLTEVVRILEEKLGVSLGGTVTQGVYECNLTQVISKLPIPTAYAPFESKPEHTFTPYSLYPYITRDIALWVGEEVAAESIDADIVREGGPLLQHVRLFDTFKKEGRISYAFRLIFQSFEKTLTDEEVEPIMKNIETTLKERGFEIR